MFVPELNQAIGRGVAPPFAPLEGLPVLLIPGFLASDLSLASMARWFKSGGWAPRRAGIAVNIDCSSAEVGRLERRLEAIADEAGKPVVIVGQSRGGMLGRVLAVRRPDLVSVLITLGSPLTPKAVSNTHPLIQVNALALSMLGDLGVPRVLKSSCAKGLGSIENIIRPKGEACCESFWWDLLAPFPAIPFLSCYSEQDAVVNYKDCFDPAAKMVNIGGSHLGMGYSPTARRVIANFLVPVAP